MPKRLLIAALVEGGLLLVAVVAWQTFGGGNVLMGVLGAALLILAVACWMAVKRRE